MKILSKFKNILMATLVVVVLFAAGIHSAADSHSNSSHTDKHSDQSCAVCFAIHTIQSTTFSSPISISLFVVAEEVQEVLSFWAAPFFVKIFLANYPPTGPPV